MYRRFRARRPRGRGRTWGKGRTLVLCVFTALGLAFLFVSWLDSRMTPMLLPLAETQVSNAVTAAVTRRVEAALAAGGLRYGDMVTVEKDEGGRVTSLTANTAALNALRGEILTGVLADVETLAQETIPIPIGNLTRFDLFSERGPAIRVGVLTTGIARGTFENAFSAVGVNQTHHQVSLSVDVAVTLLLPSGPVERVITTQVPVAETIIVGEVPRQYISIGTGDP